MLKKLKLITAIVITLNIASYAKAAIIELPSTVTSTKKIEEVKQVTAPKINYTEKDKFCLAKNIYYEARSESEYGQRAVAQVTLNRVKSPKFKNSICGVVHEPGQFSWTNDRSKKWSVPSGKKWTEASQLAENILLAGVAIEKMDDVLFFHSIKINPKWKNMQKFAVIGNHVFYRNG
jgi:spore germination cell wall hydrolase CwlJ-like protein